MLKLPKKLVLDYKRWVCGDEKLDNKCSHGTGDSSLLNKNGYMCCLGQWCRQTDKKLKIINECAPGDLQIVIHPLSKKRGYSCIIDTKFSSKCMSINDDEHTTIAEKVRSLINECRKIKRELFLKNFPKTVLKELDEMKVKYNVLPKSNKIKT